MSAITTAVLPVLAAGESGYLVLVMSPSDDVVAIEFHPTPPGGDQITATALIQAVNATYKTALPKAKRILYRCVLLKKPVVAIARLSRITNTMASRHRVYVGEVVRHDTLTRARAKPAVLADADPQSFIDEYRRVLVDGTMPNHTPTHAIVVYHEDDRLALRVLGALYSVVSVGIGIALQFIPF